MLNRFVSYFTLELGYFVQDLDAQQAERAIARDGTKFLEFREMLELAARIPRIIMVTISDCVIICSIGTVLFKTTSKKILQKYTYYIIIQKSITQSKQKTFNNTFFDKCCKTTSLHDIFCILKAQNNVMDF